MPRISKKSSSRNSRVAEFDLVLAERIKARRILRGMSQEDLAVAIGVTFQQVQKYERGINRVSASRLVLVAKALDVTPSFFFSERPQRGDELDEDALKLLQMFLAIKDKKLKKKIVSEVIKMTYPL